MSTITDVKDKVAYVTGASSGIGLEVARGFLDNGWNVVLNGRNEARLNTARDELATKTGATVSEIITAAALSARATASLSELTSRRLGKAIDFPSS